MDIEERFAPLMAAALHYADTAEGLSMSLEDIQKRLLTLAEEEKALPLVAEDSGLPDISEERRHELEEARFAVYAWADEKLLNAQRPDAGTWISLSLQCHYFSTTEAGEQFFSHLSALLDSLNVTSEHDGELLELAKRLELARNLAPGHMGADALRVFALCLLYGFQGRLFGQKETLVHLRNASLALLKRPEAMPAPKQTTSRHVEPSLFQRLEPLAYVLVPVAVCALFWLYCADLLANIAVKGF